MKIIIVGGTGFLGYRALLVALKKGYSVNAFAIDDVGLDGKYLMRDIITNNPYYDASETAEKLSYKRGGLNEAIVATLKACYPEKF